MAKVCIVIPCFNHGKYIDEAIKSVLNQTYHDIEIIVVDDGSTDEFTIERLKSINYPKTKLIYQENSGPVVARNNAIAQTYAEYILPLDADDYFDKTFVEKAVCLLRDNNTYGAVGCYIQLFGDITGIVKLKGGNSSEFILSNNACVSTLFRKKCWEEENGYNINMNEGYEDWDFWLSITERGWKIAMIEETLFYYRKVSNTSRDVKADRLRPKLIKQLVENHLETYSKHIVEYAYHKEKEILLLKQEKHDQINAIQSSTQFRIGKLMVNPRLIFKKITKLLMK